MRECVASDPLAAGAVACLGGFGSERARWLAKAGLKKKTAELEQALRGMVGTHQRLMLRNLLNHVDFLARQIGLMDREMAERMRPFEACHRDAGRHLRDCTTVSCGGCQRLQHVCYRVSLEEVA